MARARVLLLTANGSAGSLKEITWAIVPEKGTVRMPLSLFYLSIRAEIVSKQPCWLAQTPSVLTPVPSRLTSFAQGHTQNQLRTGQYVPAPPGEKLTLLTAHKRHGSQNLTGVVIILLSPLTPEELLFFLQNRKAR